MGCLISCHYFKLFSSFLELVVRFEMDSRSLIHYLDDFLFIASGSINNCTFLLDTFRFWMCQFKVPLLAEKMEDPTTTI